MSLTRSSFLGTAQSFISGANKGQSRTLPDHYKQQLCLQSQHLQRTHQEQKHTEHMPRDKGLSSRGILDYALARYLHVHTRAHTTQHCCQIPDQLNMCFKKAHKNPTNYLQNYILTPALQSGSQPTHLFVLMDLPLRKHNV